MYYFQLSFHFNEITARSSSLSNESRQMNEVTSPHLLSDDQLSEYSLKCGAIFDKIRKSDVQFHKIYNKSKNVEPTNTFEDDIETINVSDSSSNSWNPEMQDSLISKLQNEFFTPADLAIAQLEKDERDWRQNQDTLPTKKPDSQNEISCFSGYMGDITGSTNQEKISMTDFFKEKSENISAFNFKSPEKKRKPVPLIDLTESIIDSPRHNFPTETQEPAKMESSRLSDSVMSVTQIARALEDLGPQHSPRKVMDYLMNPKKYNSSQNISPTYRNSMRDSKENIGDQKTLTPQRKASQTIVLGEISNINRQSLTPMNEKTVTPRKSSPKIVISDENDFDAKNNVILINDSSDDKIFLNSQNNTVSSIKESPSVSCSELQFSDDPDSSVEIHGNLNDWIEIEQSSEVYKTCSMVESDIWVNIILHTNHWILYTVELASVKLENQFISNIDNVILVRLPDKNDLLKLENKQSFLVQYLALVVGHFQLSLIIKMKDMVTKAEKELRHTLVIDSEKVDLNVSEKILNFNTLPEDSFKSLNLSIVNNSKIDITVNLAIVQEYNIFSLGNKDQMNSSNPELSSASKLFLPREQKTVVPIFMHAPELAALQCDSHMKELLGKLVVYFQNKVTKILHEIDLIGRIGFTKIQFRCSCLPMILIPNQSKGLNVKNAGVVSMELKAFIFDGMSKTVDDNFTIEPCLLSLKPSQSGGVTITYNSNQLFAGSIHRVLRLEYENGPSFACDIEVTNDKMLKLNRSAGRSPISSAKSPILNSRR